MLMNQRPSSSAPGCFTFNCWIRIAGYGRGQSFHDEINIAFHLLLAFAITYRLSGDPTATEASGTVQSLVFA